MLTQLMLGRILEKLDKNCVFSVKHYVEVGLQGHRVRDEADLQERIRASELVPDHATAYFRHIGINCASFTEVRVFDN